MQRYNAVWTGPHERNLSLPDQSRAVELRTSFGPASRIHLTEARYIEKVSLRWSSRRSCRIGRSFISSLPLTKFPPDLSTGGSIASLTLGIDRSREKIRYLTQACGASHFLRSLVIIDSCPQ